ncbi:MAG: spiro-SPASM protein, partial [Leptospiraceae bacterium]|nr:spiro-SPASM protein [Leptospiraceae bacterium]
YDWYPLLDATLTGSVFEWHRTYLAHFTYGENLPLGLAPDFCSREFLETVPAEVRIDDLRAYVFKHIDRYDVEIFFQPPDLRQYRLDFSMASARSQRLVRDVLATDAQLQYKGLGDYLLKYPEVMRPFPSCLEIELSADTDGLAPVCYPTLDAGKSRSGAHLEMSLIEKLIQEIEAHALVDDLSIILGGPGECGLHPNFLEIVHRLAGSDSVRQLFIETYGLALTPEMQTALNEIPAAEKIQLIIRCNTLQADRFSALYGVDRLAQQLQHVQALEARTDLRYTVYAEMLRMEINADEVDDLFERFKETGIQVLLAAYNRFAGRLPERRAADLTPLHRDFCWHLARDVYINAEAKIPLCKQDPYALGPMVMDFHTSTLMDYWQHTLAWHAASVRGRHESIPMPCLQCDEWYTFNA